ncbi:MAG: hypothetical protein Q9209_006166 [Squamulea sp. 1 TL-2023]
MTTTVGSPNSPRTPKEFRLSDDSPGPLNNPDTTYLTTVPQLSTGHLTSQAGNWQQLVGTPSRSPIAPGIYVPGPPTPRTPRLRNDTPTPAATTPGSWRQRRRQGQMIDRPPRVPEDPDAISSIPNMPSDKLSASTAADSRGSGESKSDDRQGQLDPQRQTNDTLIQTPPPARVALRSGQLDGTAEEAEGLSHTPNRQSCYQKLCGSLRSIPSKLSLKEKNVNRDIKEGGNSPADERRAKSARPLAATQDKTKRSWMASLRSAKNSVRGLRHRGSASDSLSRLFNPTGSRNSTSRQSESATPQDLIPFDDERHPRTFVSPKFIDESGSPVPDPFPEITAAEEREEREEREAKERAKQLERELAVDLDYLHSDGAALALATCAWPRMK